MTFSEMLKEARTGMGWRQADIAKSLGISVQYVCDLENGLRMPLVIIVNCVCEWMGLSKLGRDEWHKAGARSHGWEV